MWLWSTRPDHFPLSVAGVGSGERNLKRDWRWKERIVTVPSVQSPLSWELSVSLCQRWFPSHPNISFSLIPPCVFPPATVPPRAAEAFTGSGRMEALSFWPHSPPSSSPFHFLSLASFSGSHVIADLSRVLTLSWWTRSLPPPLIKDPHIFSVFLVFVHLSFYWLIYLDDSSYQASISSVLNWFLSNSSTFH